MDKCPTVLIVDDEPFNVDYLEQELEDIECETISAENGREALDQVMSQFPDLILLDIMMPEMDGFEVLTHLKNDERLREIPVIVISALDDTSNVVKGIEMGAEDYISKPFDPVLLHARVNACLEKKRIRDREAQVRRQMDQELARAWQVQSGFLPRELPDIPGWHFAATLQPSQQTSGDFYDLIPLPNDKLGILIADVAGKGVGAGLSMVLSRTLIRTFAVQYHARPDTVLEAANERILADLTTNQAVTVFYGILDVATGTLTYCNAGHCPPYLCRRTDAYDGSPEIETLLQTSTPLGVRQDAAWERRAVRINPGEALILYTDGLIDAQNAQGVHFGQERLLAPLRSRALFQAQQGGSAQALQDAVIAQMSDFVGDAPQLDDIALTILVRDK